MRRVVFLDIVDKPAALFGAGGVGVDAVGIEDDARERITKPFAKGEARVEYVAITVASAGAIGARDVVLERMTPFVDEDVGIELVRVDVFLAQQVNFAAVPV